eukprot:3895354-Lingulodinium_polyedra.AAC.1
MARNNPERCAHLPKDRIFALHHAARPGDLDARAQGLALGRGMEPAPANAYATDDALAPANR